MSKKSDAYYFDNFIACADDALQAARILDRTLNNFNLSRLDADITEMHKVENDGDIKKHAMMEILSKSFIAPLEREDIIALNQNIDDVTDAIEDVLLRIYMNNVSAIRQEAATFTKIIVRCCETLKDLLTAFRDFKKSKTLPGLIIKINELEEEGDKLFMSSMRILHTTGKDPLEILAWREIYTFLEKCCDACEHTADVVESVMMKNT